MRQRALGRRSPIEQPIDLDGLLTVLLAATLEVNDKLTRAVWDVYATVYGKDLPYPRKSPPPHAPRADEPVVVKSA
jgi:hypothetical protein